MREFFFLSGLPRSGSTLLSCILDQNPDIHAEGNSGVCQLMWEAQTNSKKNQQLLANNKIQVAYELVQYIPLVYYKDVTKNLIVDKCRSWTLPDNMRLIENYITKTPKIIVMIRPCAEIIASYAKLMQDNSHTENIEQIMLEPLSEPLMRSYDGVMFAKKYNEGQFIFVNYNDLVNKTKETIDDIYKHCGWTAFEHDFDNIVNNHPEDDSFYNLLGMHDVAPTISKRQLDIKLSNETMDKCAELDEAMFA